MAQQYFGKYSGLVKDNQDDGKQGRLQIAVPAVFAPEEVVTARPVLPYGVYFLPEIDAKVWVEFEGGDPNLPLWTGVQYGPGEWAAESDASAVRAVKTAAGHLLVFDDTDGGETILVTEGANGHVIRLDADGITVEHGQAGHTIVLASDAITVSHGQVGHSIEVGSDGISASHGGGQNSLAIDAVKVTAKTATSTIELGPAGVTISGVPLLKLNDGAAPVVRAGIDTGVGNLGAPVVMIPGQFTVLA